MGAFRRQFVLASAAIAAAMILSSASAQAGYVSVAAGTEQGGADALANPAALLWAESDTPVSAGGDSANPQPDSDDPHAPAPPSSPLLKRLPTACNFGQSGAGSPSTSATGGPSSPPAGDLLRPQVPPLEPTSLLPPQTGDVHTFSVASFLFRPPRAA